MAIDKPRDRPKVPEVARFARAYYNDHGVGGSLHIVLDDGNLEDSSVQFCIERAEERGDAPGAELGRMLLQMTLTQRRSVRARDHQPLPGDRRYDRLVVRGGQLAIAVPDDPDYGPDELMFPSEVREKLARAAERLREGLA